MGARGTQDAVANGDTRTLTLYHVHTKERGTFTFRQNGSYDHETLRRLNHFLRDWRNDEQTTMSPRLFDIVWYAQREAGGTDAVHVMSAYRSPGTNEMLRRRSRAVAKESQHIQGNAMDVHVPGVSMAKVRELAMRLERGGVGYYPSAGSPFVHIDVGTVRSWPRMSRDQLERLFPDGKTVHLPRDGVPLANYQAALAEVRARGDSALDYDIITRSRGNTLWALLFGGRGDEGGEDTDTPMRAATRVASRSSTPASRGRAGTVDVVSAPASSDDVMRPTVMAVAPVPQRARIEQEVRPQPGSEPIPAPVAPAAAPQAQPIQVAALPIPPIRPRGLASNELALSNEPLPPVRPPSLTERAQIAALAEAVAQPLAEPAPQRVAGLPLPPLRAALPPSIAAEAVSGETAPRLVAGIPTPPVRPSGERPLAPELVRTPEPAQAPAPRAVASAEPPRAPEPRNLREVLAGSQRNAPVLETSPLTQAFAPMPPQRPQPAITVALPKPPERPIAMRKPLEPQPRKEARPTLHTEPEATRRPDYVVTVGEPKVEAEVKSGVVASRLGAMPAPQPQNSFSGSFVRPIAPSFTLKAQ